MAESSKSSRPVFFFDIDNTLYPRSKKVLEMMSESIDQYLVDHLALSEADANMLRMRYFKEYGLTIEGLVRHHKIDPMDFDQKVDAALALDDVLMPDAHLRKLLEDVDKSKVRLWLFTNAHVTHGTRVVKLLGVNDLFEGITYCDYTQKRLICKPQNEMYEKAERQAGVAAQDCYFVDDSYLNCKHGSSRGWTTVQFLAPEDREPTEPGAKYQIRDLDELKTIFPQFFKISPTK